VNKHSILDLLEQNNEFPIIFIGSGISKRYLNGYPSWEELLKRIWEYSGRGENFYSYLNKLKRKLSSVNQKLDDIDFIVNTEVAKELEQDINDKFDEEKISIDGLTSEDAYKKSISPFKKLLSNKFSNYKMKDDLREEIESFSKMLLKSQVIFTTNYDTFVEDLYNQHSANGIKKFIGQQGFFERTPEYAEIYKIHGCATDEKTLIITQDDYAKFDMNSVLISAKIISMLLYSPIIFIGYSLTDRNVRKILRDFSTSLSPKEKQTLEKRLIIIEHKKGENDIIEEIETDTDLDCRMTVIKTDNYQKIYDSISKIDQGVAPTEIRKYQHVIKKLIVERGKSGTLDTFLVSPNELDNMEATIKNRNIVLAIADKAVIFQAPTIVKYCYEYITENFDQNLEIMLRFIATQQSQSRLPMIKYLTEDNIKNCELSKNEKQKLKDRLSNQGILDSQIDQVPYKQTYDSMDELFEKETKIEKVNQAIAYNIRKMDLERVKTHILSQLQKLMDNREITVETQLRRLCLIYDLTKNEQK